MQLAATATPRQRQQFALCVIAFGLILGGAPRTLRGEWQNSLKPAGSALGEIELVKDGKALCPIQIAVNANVIEKRAAEELQYWIKQITSAKPDVTTTDTGPTVRIRTDPSLGSEGYSIAIEGDDLVLAGGTGRGVVNAVYAFLEEDVGCRFYTNESIKLPIAETLSVKPVARTYGPRLELRDPFYAAVFDATWSMRNRTNSPVAPVGEEYGGHIDYGGLFVHTHAALLPAEKYFSDHPDYFAMNEAGQRYAAQLCATHPEVAKIVAGNVLSILQASPHTEIVSVSKNDNAGDQVCYCERCKKRRAAEGGGDMGCQLILVNAVAEAVEKHYPHVVVDTLAYLETVQPPKSIRPRSNVAIRLCNDRVGAWTHPFTPAEQCDVAKAIAAWSKIHDRLYIWDYNVNFKHFLAPMPNVDVMAANIRFWVKSNAKGVMLQGGHQGPAEGDEMKAWVTSKLLWDPSRDEKALVQDFIWGHYGPAAPALAEYERLLNSLRRTHAADMASPPGGIRFPMNVAFLTKDFTDKATSIFARAKTLAGSEEQVLRRVERAELPILYVRCWRGPKFCGPDYGEAVAAFERIARREKVERLSEKAAKFERALVIWKSRISKPAAVAQ